MKKYIIGLGCSWTQGEGGYPEEVWKEHGGRVQVRGRDDYYLRHIEHENSWVNVLCRDYFPEYTSVNLGVRGIGNLAAANQLHFADKIDFDNSTGIIIMMLSGLERLDFWQQDPLCPIPPYVPPDDMYSTLEYKHYKWRTAWPFAGHGDAEEPLWAVYGKMLHSDHFVVNNSLIAILNAQTFAKAHNYKFIFANAFNDPYGLDIKTYMQKYSGNTFFNKIDWSSYLHTEKDYRNFVHKLVLLDGLLPKEELGGWYNFYKKRDWPATYLTNCDGAHPTIEGYKVIASELADFINSHGYVKNNRQFCQP